MRWSVLSLVPACGFGARAATGSDAAARDTAAFDVASDTPGDTPSDCMGRWLSHTVRFQTPAPLLELNTTDYERDPYVTPDELNIYFSATRTDTLPAGGTDIYTANRSSDVEPFGPVTKFLAGSTTTGNEGKLSMTGDGLQLFVSSNLSGSGSKGGSDIWFAQKSGVTFGALGQAHMAMVNTSAEELDPLVSPDGTAIYFAPTSGAPQQVWVATRANEAGNFGAPTELTELADIDGTGTADPAISADQRVILFTSSRTGTTGVNDIWYATRATASGTFSTPAIVPDINSTAYDGDAHLSEDGCRLYFDSTRVNGGIDWDLFVAAQQ